MGYYDTKSKIVTLCKDNAERKRIPLEKVIKHEFVHVVYDLIGGNFNPIPEPLLTQLVRENLSSEEVLSVLTSANTYSNSEEFTARILSELPDSLFIDWVAKHLQSTGVKP